MQPYSPRPSLQPTQRPAGSAQYGRAGVQVPARGGYRNPANPVDRAMMHNFNDPRPMPTSYGHFSEPQTSHTATYASSTQAMFAATPPQQTPYQQMYHFDPVKDRRDFHFPFRTLMIVLVVGAISFGAYAVYRAFTSPSPVNAEYGNTLEMEP